MTIWLIVSVVTYLVGFVFFLLYWYGENAQDEVEAPKVVILAFAVFWPPLLFLHTCMAIVGCIGLVLEGVDKGLEKVGTKLYNKIENRGE